MIKPLLSAMLSATLWVSAAVALPVEQSPRPVARPGSTALPVTASITADDKAFQRWIIGFRPRARAAGIHDKTFDAAFRDVTFNQEVIARDRSQSEFTKTIGQYLDSAVSDKRLSNGKQALRDQARTLRAIESRFGVEKEVVAAVWGLESAYGEFRGDHNVIEALATLAYDGRRGAFFEGQLIDALKILQDGDTAPRRMTGSWAGAMGHTQFIPSSYRAFAVDFTGDGKRDIWSDNPADALASTAAYLSRHGWVKGQPWGVEVRLPDGFDYAMAKKSIRKMPSEWARLGVTDVQGRPVRDYGAASVFVPMGHRGAAFLIFKNFGVIARYNSADAYVVGVGHLSDRLAGARPLSSSWPSDDRALNREERTEMQKLLSKRGFDTGGVDGLIGPKTQDAIRAYQRSRREVPDGYASLSLLQKLKR